MTVTRNSRRWFAALTVTAVLGLGAAAVPAYSSATDHGTISGTLTAGGTPVIGASVDALDTTTLAVVDHTVTAAGGSFSLDVPAPNGYFVRYAKDGEIRTSLLGGELPDATVVEVSAGGTFDATASATRVTAFVTGSVEDPCSSSCSHYPNEVVFVDTLTHQTITATTDDSGLYGLTLPAGRWAVEGRDLDGQFDPAGFGDNFVMSPLVDVPGSGDRDIGSITLTPRKIGAVAGRVTSSDGTALSYATVELLQPDDLSVVASTVTLAAEDHPDEGVRDGDFRITVAPGAYLIRASIAGYTSWLGLEPVVVEDASETSVADIALAPLLAGVSGHMYDTGGNAVAFGHVDVFDDATMNVVAHFSTDDNGAFAGEVPAPGRYLVRYESLSGDLGWLNGAYPGSGREPLVVAPDDVAPALDAVVGVVGTRSTTMQTIQVRVRRETDPDVWDDAPVTDVSVDAFDPRTGGLVASGSLNVHDDGFELVAPSTVNDFGYLIRVSSPDARYGVQFATDSGPATFSALAGFVPRFVNQGPVEVKLGLAPMAIVGSARGYDESTVPLGGSNPGLVPLGGLEVTAVDVASGRALGAAATADDGTFYLPISEASWNVDRNARVVLHFHDPTDAFDDAWSGGAPDMPSASSMVVDHVRYNYGQGEDLDRRLARFGGHIDDGAGTSLAGVTIDAYGATTGEMVASTATDAGGAFALNLPATRDGIPYVLRASSPSFETTWLQELQHDQATGAVYIGDIAVFTLHSGQSDPDVDTWPLTSTVGTVDVSVTSLGAALEGVQVGAYDAASAEPVATGTTGSDGHVHLGVAVPTGDANSAVLVHAEKVGYGQAWASAALSVPGADPVTVAPGGTSAVSIDLDPKPQVPTLADVNATEGIAATIGPIVIGALDASTDTVTIDAGDGRPVTNMTLGVNGASTSVTYDQDGTYTATLCAFDAVATSCQSFDVQVANAAPTVPGTPVVATGAQPSATGVLTLEWAPSADVAADTVTYTLERRDADDAGWSTAASGLATPAFAYTNAAPLGSGTWSFRVTATDGTATSGSSPTLSGVVVDVEAPPAPALTASPAAAYSAGGIDWWKDSVHVESSAPLDPLLADGSAGSGVVAASVAPPQDYGDGLHTYSDEVNDVVGNASTTATLTVHVDATAPTIDVTCPTTVTFGASVPPVGWSATDTGSGLSTPSAGSEAVDTATTGTHSFTITATDHVAHTTTRTCSYLVAWPFSGFASPIMPEPKLNAAKAGSTVPVKFSLSGFRGLDVLAAGSPSSGPIPCTTGPVSVGTTAAAKGGPITYDKKTDSYNYTWQTEKSWAGSCRQLIVELADGSVHTARFFITKT